MFLCLETNDEIVFSKIFLLGTNSFFDLFVNELDKVEAFMEELQTLSQAERKRIVRKSPVVVIENNRIQSKRMGNNESVHQIVQALSEEDEVEKSKLPKFLKPKRSNFYLWGSGSRP